jgi:hypothetical protein
MIIRVMTISVLMFLSGLCNAQVPDYSTLSQQLLLKARTGQVVDTILHDFKYCNKYELDKQLDTDAKRLAFWINMYNAQVIIQLKAKPELYKHRKSFFARKSVIIGGKKVSLDVIEHGILRQSKVKWGLGYIDKLFKGSFEVMYRVQRFDYRIHFALNCGAKSCPPIAYYSSDKIDEQLELAMRNYITGNCLYNEKENVLHLPAIFNWFRGDFGSKRGIFELMKRYKVMPANAQPEVVYDKYNWTLVLGNE